MHQYPSQLSLASNVNREQVFDYSLDLLAKCSAYVSSASGESLSTTATTNVSSLKNNSIDSTIESGLLECHEYFDSVLCWPRVNAGTIAKISCGQVFMAMGVPPPKNQLNAIVTIHDQAIRFQDAFATRVCDENGTWHSANWTNYTQCLPFLEDSNESSPSIVAFIVGFILFFGSIISLAFLTISMYIFFHFKTLKCKRLRVHRNLFGALIIHSALLVVISGPAVLRDYFPLRYVDYDWLCRLVLAIKLYASIASINWMFVEGLLLHTKLSGVFSEGPPFPCYYAIGWGVPAVIVIFWSSLMSITLNSSCWNGYSKSPYIWILTIPMFCALIANAVFLVNIIRILLLKIKNTVSNEMRKALKATAFLFPLLGMNQLIFCFNPRDEDQFEDAYMLINALLQSSQGMLVAILYCFTNTQVKATVKAAYCRRIMLRDVHSVRINNHHTTHHQSTIIRQANSKRNASHVEATTIDLTNGNVSPGKSKKGKTLLPQNSTANSNVKNLSVNVPLTVNGTATTSIV